jgi:ketosteroid isomerase-like protein
VRISLRAAVSASPNSCLLIITHDIGYLSEAELDIAGMFTWVVQNWLSIRAAYIAIPMKIPTILVLGAMAYVDYAAAQTTQRDMSPQPEASLQREIKSLEEARNQAVLNGDVAALDKMTSDDYTFITLKGELRTKSDILNGFASRSFHYESRQISDLKVRVYGDTAIVTGRSVQKGMENGKDYSGDYRFTRVYVKQKGRWLSVALQTTLIQQ